MEMEYAQGRIFARGCIDLLYRESTIPVHIDLLASASPLVAGLYETDPDIAQVVIPDSLSRVGIDLFLSHIVYRNEYDIASTRFTTGDIMASTNIMAFFGVEVHRFRFFDTMVSDLWKTPVKDPTTQSTVPTYACIGVSTLPQPGSDSWLILVNNRPFIETFMPESLNLLKRARFPGVPCNPSGLLEVRFPDEFSHLIQCTCLFMPSELAMVSEMQARRRLAADLGLDPPFPEHSFSGKKRRQDIEAHQATLCRILEEDNDAMLAACLGGSLDPLLSLFEEIKMHLMHIPIRDRMRIGYTTFHPSGMVRVHKALVDEWQHPSPPMTIATQVRWLSPVSEFISSCVRRRLQINPLGPSREFDVSVGAKQALEWRMRLIDMLAALTPHESLVTM